MKLALCGSARFEDDFHYWNEMLTLQGHVVYSLAVYPSRKGGIKDWYNDEEKTLLDLAHFAKIEESDGIFVIDHHHRETDPEKRYTGESTEREILWAGMRNKRIFYASNPVHVKALTTFGAAEVLPFDEERQKSHE